MKLEFIKKHVAEYSLRDLCEALEVAPSAYHAWVGRQPSTRTREDADLQQEIRIDDIASNPYQPRREFKADELSDLTASTTGPTAAWDIE